MRETVAALPMKTIMSGMQLRDAFQKVLKRIPVKVSARNVEKR